MRLVFRNLAPAILIFCPLAAYAQSVAQNNLAANPPKISSSSGACSATFNLKSAGIGDVHAFVVVSLPSGSLLELRGGPSIGGGGSISAPGSIPGSSGPQPSGNPFNCTTSHKWGVVVPYVGPHGKLGTDASGNAFYSPDGIASQVTYRSALGPGAQDNICSMANCMMTTIKALGASCKNYTVGTGALRNSNTLIAFALSSCGVPDPIPANVSAPGWGTRWEQ